MTEENFLDSVTNIKDDYILEALPLNQRKRKVYRIISRIAVACLLVIVAAGISVNAFVPVYARNLPFVGSVFTYIQDKLHVAGLYSNYSFEIGDVATDNGMSLTLKEAYCDGVNLYVSFVAESEKPFISQKVDDYVKGQLDYDVNAYIESEEGRKRLDDFGTAGLEGEFTDNYTFVGVDVFSLTGEKFPDEFTLDMEVNSISLMTENTDKEITKGDWRFSAPISINTDSIITYEVNKEENGHSIDKIVVTPIFVTIYTSYPDIYSGTTNYEVRTYTDDHADEDISSQGQYKATSGITQIPRNRINQDMHIYVVDASTLCKSGLERGTQEESKEHAIVSYDFTLE